MFVARKVPSARSSNMGFNSKLAIWLSLLSCMTILVPHAEAQEQPELALSPDSYTATYDFPYGNYEQYWNDPTNTSMEPQPKIYDPFTGVLYPENYTSATDVLLNDTVDFRPLPPTSSSEQIVAAAIAKVNNIYNDPVFENNTCARALTILDVAQMTALAAPADTYMLAQELCVLMNVTAFDTTYAEYCETAYLPDAIGNIMTTVYSLLDVHSSAGEAFAYYFFNSCDLPPISPLNVSQYLTPKPDPLPAPKPPSGLRGKVLHISDFHLDPRYDIGAESQCGDYMCCKLGAWNPASPNNVTAPAARFGSFKCDTPLSLAYAAAEAIPVLTGSDIDPFAFTIFTGDIVPHATAHTLSIGTAKEYEYMVFDILDKMAGGSRVLSTLGNHDTNPEAFSMPAGLPNGLGLQDDWVYKNFALLNLFYGWLSPTEAAFAMYNYGNYVTQTTDGLKIISFNSICAYYLPHLGGYLNYTADSCGILTWLIGELQIAEDNGESVILMTHVPTAYAEGNANAAPADLFYQIVDRYSPHVIRNTFFGHTHDDQLSIYYANNASVISPDTALTPAWIAPSLTPQTNLNNGFRYYNMDLVTGEIYDMYTYVSNVSNFPSLDEQKTSGPTFELEYSAREAYGGNISWPTDAPLNATWWHLVTEQFAINSTLVNMYYRYQTKNSVLAGTCDSACQANQVCLMRSASVPLSGLCPPA